MANITIILVYWEERRGVRGFRARTMGGGMERGIMKRGKANEGCRGNGNVRTEGKGRETYSGNVRTEGRRGKPILL